MLVFYLYRSEPPVHDVDVGEATGYSLIDLEESEGRTQKSYADK